MNMRPKAMNQARRVFLGGAAATAGLLALRWMGRAAGQPPATADAETQKRIEAALPAKAFVPPRKRRRLLIFDLNVGYGGHGSIPTANTAFTLMGERTGAFETVVSRDPAVFKPESLRQFDAVFFNNTVGNCFEDPALRQSLVEFIYAGGGLMGVHGTSVAFTKWPGAIEDWPEFGIMLGARGANHKTNDEHVFIKLDDPTHPVNQAFGGQDFDYRDEFFRVHEPYSRDRVRVLDEHRHGQDRHAAATVLRRGRASRQRLRAGLGPPVRPGPCLLLRLRAPPFRLLGPQDAAVLPGGHAIRLGRPRCPDNAERQADPGDPGPGTTRLATGSDAPAIRGIDPV